MVCNKKTSFQKDRRIITKERRKKINSYEEFILKEAQLSIHDQAICEKSALVTQRAHKK